MNGARADKAALWSRVSTTEQNLDEQRADLLRMADNLGLTVKAEFITQDSASLVGRAGGKGQTFQQQTKDLLSAVNRGDFGTVLIWDLSRLTREGPEFTYRMLRLIAEAGADVKSFHDPWLNTHDDLSRDVMIGMTASLAKAESIKRRERATMGYQRYLADVAAGKPRKPWGGRKPGARDKQPRKGGTGRAWTDERREALAERNRQRAAERRQAAGE